MSKLDTASYREAVPSADATRPLSSTPSTLLDSVMNRFRTRASRIAMLAGLSSVATGCLPDLLSPEELDAKLAKYQCESDAGIMKEGKCYMPAIDTTNGSDGADNDTNLPPGRTGENKDDADATADAPDAVDGDAAVDVADVDDANDGKTDDGDAVADADDANDAKTDDGDAVADADDANDAKTDDGDAVADADDANDAKTDDGDAVADVDDANDANIEVAPNDVVFIDDADIVEIAPNDVVFIDDADIVEIAPNDVVDGGGSDAADLNGDGAPDGSSETNDVADIADTPPPITCNGFPVGTVQVIPTTGPIGETGVCKNGSKFCTVTGDWYTIPAIDPSSGESCDGKDNNCNGQTDEGLEQEISYSGPLGTKGVGACHAKKTDCINGTTQTTQEEVTPKLEICANGINEACNGVIDGWPCDCDPDGDGIITDMFDPKLLDGIRASLNKGPNDPITLIDAQTIVSLSAVNKDVADIAGIVCLQKLAFINLTKNNIPNISALQWLPGMKDVYLGYNKIPNFSPLVENPNFGKGSSLTAINGNSMPIDQHDKLIQKGVKVY